MKKLMTMALLALCMTANANPMTEDEDNATKNGVVLDEKSNHDWTMHFAVGVNIPVDATNGYEFAPFRSWEFAWTVAQYDYHPKGASQTYSVGLGLNWRSYGLKDKDRLMMVKDPATDVIGLGIFPNNADNRSSNIHTAAITMPLLFNQRICKDFSLSVGAQLNWNVYGTLGNHYALGDDEIDVTTKDIKYRPFTVDVMAIAHIHGIGIYGKYSPMSVLKKNAGPEFKSVAVGIYF